MAHHSVCGNCGETLHVEKDYAEHYAACQYCGSVHCKEENGIWVPVVLKDVRSEHSLTESAQ